MNQRSIRFWCTLAALLLSACSTTQLTDSWQEPAFHRSDMQQVLVVAKASNTSNRFLFETGFINALSEYGIKAHASFTVIGDQYPTREAVEKELKTHAYDHIIVVSLGGIDIEKDYVPARTDVVYVGPYYGNWYGSWNSWGGNTVTMTREAYVDTQANVILTTSIYDVASTNLSWAGRSKTFDVNSVSALADSLARQMVRDIKN